MISKLKFDIWMFFIFLVVGGFFLAVKVIDVPKYAIEQEKEREKAVESDQGGPASVEAQMGETGEKEKK